MDMEKKKVKRTQQSGTQTDRDKDTNGQVQGHKCTGTQMDRDWDTEQVEGQRHR